MQNLIHSRPEKNQSCLGQTIWMRIKWDYYRIQLVQEIPSGLMKLCCMCYTARNLESKGRKIFMARTRSSPHVRRVRRNRRNQACPRRLVDPQTQLRFPLGFFLCSPVVSPRIASGKSEEATTSDEGKTGNCRRTSATNGRWPCPCWLLRVCLGAASPSSLRGNFAPLFPDLSTFEIWDRVA
jgi:hypothetical protein